jgi:hypothetical protein
MTLGSELVKGEKGELFTKGSPFYDGQCNTFFYISCSLDKELCFSQNKSVADI